MRKSLLCLSLAICVGVPPGAAAQSQPAIPPPLTSERAFVRDAVLEERDFPLLSSILNDAPIRALLAQDAVLHALTVERWKKATEANHACASDIECIAKTLQFTPRQIDDVSAALRRLYTLNPTLRDFVRTRLQPSEVYVLDTSESDETRFIDAWEHSANAMNQIVSTYCEGAAPRYREIDAMTYQADSKSFRGLLTILLDGLSIEDDGSNQQRPLDRTLFFEPTLRFSLRLLQSNSRDEAGRFWPLETGENAAALKSLPSITWSHFPYSVIVIPGAGSEISNVALSPWGKERLRLGVEAYRSGKAPFLLVSGGYVHPSQTPFCEALEMKRYLMEVYGLPASAILLEPHARHTTTNLRNASRQVFLYGVAPDKEMLIVSDETQVNYIAGDSFQKRSRDELGYLPVRIGNRLSPTQLEAMPSKQSLYSDAIDPLDP